MGMHWVLPGQYGTVESHLNIVLGMFAHLFIRRKPTKKESKSLDKACLISKVCPLCATSYLIGRLVGIVHTSVHTQLYRD